MLQDQGPKDRDLEHLARVLLENAGLRFGRARTPALRRVLSARVEATGSGSAARYCAFVASRQPEAEAEISRLIEAVTVKETLFFRDAPQWQALQDHVLPELIRLSVLVGRPLRVWSAGCSTGEEPYTLAMILKEHFGSPRTRIHATDIDRTALEAAARGHYSARAVRRLDGRYLDRYFQASGTGYVVDESVRSMVEFEYLNLADPDPRSWAGHLTNLDLILCRNVIIYLARELSQQLLCRFSECLRDGGYLVLGHAETQCSSPLLDLVQYDNAFLHRKGARPTPTVSSALRESGSPPTAPSSTVAASQKPAEARCGPCDPLKLGEYYLDQEMTTEALSELHKAIARDPLSPAAYLLEGMSEKAQGAVERSIGHFRKVLYLDRDSVMGRYHLADSYRRLGNLASARREYVRLLGALGSGEEGAIVAYSGGMTRRTVFKLCSAALDALGK